MAIQTAGIRSAKSTEIKIENQSSLDLPKETEANVRKAMAFLPIEHLRGLEKIRLVDFIKTPQMKNSPAPITGDLPGLYHPRVGNQAAWLEVSTGALLQPTESLIKRWMAKSSFKSNIAGILFSLVGQHYYFTLRHSVKKQNLEPQVRQYAQKNLKEWGEKQAESSWRGRLFKPVRPYLERWAKWLNKRAADAQKKG